MRASCHHCMRDVLYTFLYTVATPKSNSLGRSRWTTSIRCLTNDTRGAEPDSSATQSILHQGPNAGEPTVFPRRRPIDIAAWKEQRASILGKGPTDTNVQGQKLNKEEPVSRPDEAEIIPRPTLGRKKDRWRNRPGAAAGSASASEKQTESAASQHRASSHTTSDAKPKKDRWRNRVKSNDSGSAASSTVADNQHTSIRTPTKNERIALPKVLRGFAKPAYQPPAERKLEAWRVQKEAIKKKLGGAAWNPLKKLSPDAMRGVKQLHAEDAGLWSTENLAKHFEISPDAIRRILKSRWEPTDGERQKQEERWVKRGESIWDRYVELGKKAPRKWRGLDPIPAPKRTMYKEKVEVNAEEWSRDPAGVAEDHTLGHDLGLAHRIM